MNDPAKPGFDAYASEYDAALAEGLSVSGESKEFFAQGRISHLAGCLKGTPVSTRLHYGFRLGTGTNTPFLLKLDGFTSLLGVDTSESSRTSPGGSYRISARRFRCWISTVRMVVSILFSPMASSITSLRRNVLVRSIIFFGLSVPEACWCSGKTIPGIQEHDMS